MLKDCLNFSINSGVSLSTFVKYNVGEGAPSTLAGHSFDCKFSGTVGVGGITAFVGCVGFVALFNHVTIHSPAHAAGKWSLFNQ